LENDTYAFIVRIWGEPTDDAENPKQWRGSIDQVGCNKRLYFSDLDGITRFIREQIEENSTHSMLGWKRLLVRISNDFRYLRKRYRLRKSG
jgi:hypothetical protein